MTMCRRISNNYGDASFLISLYQISLTIFAIMISYLRLKAGHSHLLTMSIQMSMRLKLNVSEDENSLDFELALSVAAYFGLENAPSNEIMTAKKYNYIIIYSFLCVSIWSIAVLVRLFVITELEIESQKNEEEKIPEVIDIFNELQEKLSSYGVIFNFMFDAKHDRKNL